MRCRTRQRTPRALKSAGRKTKPAQAGRDAPPTGSVVIDWPNPSISGMARLIASRTAGSFSERSWLALLSHTSVIQIEVSEAGSRATT